MCNSLTGVGLGQHKNKPDIRTCLALPIGGKGCTFHSEIIKKVDIPARGSPGHSQSREVISQTIKVTLLQGYLGGALDGLPLEILRPSNPLVKVSLVKK